MSLYKLARKYMILPSSNMYHTKIINKLGNPSQFCHYHLYLVSLKYKRNKSCSELTCSLTGSMMWENHLYLICKDHCSRAHYYYLQIFHNLQRCIVVCQQLLHYDPHVLVVLLLLWLEKPMFAKLTMI